MRKIISINFIFESMHIITTSEIYILLNAFKANSTQRENSSLINYGKKQNRKKEKKMLKTVKAFLYTR